MDKETTGPQKTILITDDDPCNTGVYATRFVQAGDSDGAAGAPGTALTTLRATPAMEELLLNAEMPAVNGFGVRD